MTDAAQQEAVARIIVDRLGAGSIGMTDAASMAAALPIAEEVLALIQAPIPDDLADKK